MDNNELGTKLGDLSAYLSNMKHNLDYSLGACDDELSNALYHDLEPAMDIVNELYSKFIQFDTRK